MIPSFDVARVERGVIMSPAVGEELEGQGRAKFRSEERTQKAVGQQAEHGREHVQGAR